MHISSGVLGLYHVFFTPEISHVRETSYSMSLHVLEHLFKENIVKSAISGKGTKLYRVEPERGTVNIWNK